MWLFALLQLIVNHYYSGGSILNLSQFYRSVESEMQGLSPLLATEDKQGDSSAPETKNLNLCAPDTLEVLEGTIILDIVLIELAY